MLLHCRVACRLLPRAQHGTTAITDRVQPSTPAGGVASRSGARAGAFPPLPQRGVGGAGLRRGGHRVGGRQGRAAALADPQGVRAAAQPLVDGYGASPS
jgi:hypothetical protein